MLRVFSNRRSRHLVLILVDIICLAAAIALIIGVYPSSTMRLTPQNKLIHGAILAACIFLFRILFRVYAQSWRYANESAYLLFIIADALGGILYFIITDRFIVYKITAIHTLAVLAVELLFTLSTRFTYQWRRTAVRSPRKAERLSRREGQAARIQTRIAIVGASDMGVQLAAELLNEPNARYLPVCFIDKNPEKVGNYILGLKVYPEDEHTSLVAEKINVDTFVIAIPDKNSVFLKELFDFYKQFGHRVMVYDYPAQRLLQGSQAKSIRDINIEDLLTREKVENLGDDKAGFYRNQVILVTGAGGSIGSELCRQLFQMAPRQLIMLDIYENGVYDLCQELSAHQGQTELVIEIASVRDKRRIDEIMGRYYPGIVFHAAAHKHVPLMEHNPGEAVKNNVFGTLNVVNSAEEYKVKRFVMVSTDKAVNPTNIMGASKRLCEMIIQSRKDSGTDFVAVRFGNVLGSNGSVIPLFMRQIAHGGPITITDKRIIRYFMMIPEAAQLVLQTGCRAEKGDIYVLNMGQPVKILDLAENLIRLNGLEPYTDIDIIEVGLRPGEKLYEELLISKDRMRQTDDHRIFIEHEPGPSREEVEQKLLLLREALEDNAGDALLKAVRETVPSYCEAEELNLRAIREAEKQAAGII